jgi:acyl-CoA dehydrogenase
MALLANGTVAGTVCREEQRMTPYAPPLDDLAFVLHDLLEAERQGIRGYPDLDRETTSAVLAEAGRLAAEVLAPLNAPGDREGCRLENGAVRTPGGFPAAYAALVAGGWPGLDADPAYGGQGMPYLLQTAVGEMFTAANMALHMYLGLSHGAVSALEAHGSDAQKALYLPPLVAGTWTGTMNLTEPHCGTDLGLIRTRAEPRADGSHAVTGQKIWISAGEHDLAENIVHLVLARLPEAPAGTRGLSLFIVPKFLPGPGRALGARNAVTCGGLESKMGIHGNATCVMHYEGATGFLVGEPHKGMRAMFTMMNEARIGVGLQAIGQADRAYQAARAFAREREQGRAPGGAAAPERPADPILVHPDVRRMLMDQKSFIEGARAFALWAAMLVDKSRREHDAQAEALVSLLTPVIKGFLTDRGFESAVVAQQVLGGAGFTRDGGVEQIVRDARITMVYEGTNGIQAIDLVGRKLGLDGGGALRAFLAEARETAAAASGQDPGFEARFAAPLRAALDDLEAAVLALARSGGTDPGAALAGAHDLMLLLGHCCLGLMWVRMAMVAQQALAEGRGDAGFLHGKLTTGQHYMARQLPATALHRARVMSGGEALLGLCSERF